MLLCLGRRILLLRWVVSEPKRLFDLVVPSNFLKAYFFTSLSNLGYSKIHCVEKKLHESHSHRLFLYGKKIKHTRLLKVWGMSLLLYYDEPVAHQIRSLLTTAIDFAGLFICSHLRVSLQAE